MRDVSQALWARSDGDTEREMDVSATSLEQTVRVPLEDWPHSLLVTVTGIDSGKLAADVLDKVRKLTIRTRKPDPAYFLATSLLDEQCLTNDTA